VGRPAALITGIRTDLPGQITAQVTENVYDSPSPQGSAIIKQSRIVYAISAVLSRDIWKITYNTPKV